MKSYRDPYELVQQERKIIVEKDVLELGRKIAEHKEGLIPDDKFRALRLARGVYGQRQQGVQMIRIKLPYGRVTANQLRRIASVSDEYSTGRLHITTRQDIQIHYVSLDRTPQLWEDLEKDDITLREACGNTVRNVTASDIAGIDPDELFDVTPYADLVYRYFLRKPFSQELGRKIKIAFSSSDKDDALTFIHDFGFIPRIEIRNNIEVKGFKVLVGGGLGAQPFLAKVAFEFLEAEKLIPFVEAAIRVFDRHGERNSRNKARLKFLINKIGFEAFIDLVKEEIKAVQYVADLDFILFENQINKASDLKLISIDTLIEESVEEEYRNWLKTNVFSQKQAGLFAVYVKVRLGDFYTNQARVLAALLDQYELSELRFTIDQNIQIRNVRAEFIEPIYEVLKKLGLNENGYNSVADVTACPGTDTCNLGISNSTDVALFIEDHIRLNYPKLLQESGIKIKISGCMNSCGQHGMAHIGFHGSSIKTKEGTLPALQLLLGGGRNGGGDGRIAEKVIKLPSKRVLQLIDIIFNDFDANQNEEDFNQYYDRQGNNYFYQLLKPLADLESIENSDYIDWGNEEKFATAIGVGECAGVMIDLVKTLFFDASEKAEKSVESYFENRFADSIYFAYAALVHAAKALLVDKNVRCNTQQGIITDFDIHFENQFGFNGENKFSDFVSRINKNEPSQEFAQNYVTEAIEVFNALIGDNGNKIKF